MGLLGNLVMVATLFSATILAVWRRAASIRRHGFRLGACCCSVRRGVVSAIGGRRRAAKMASRGCSSRRNAGLSRNPSGDAKFLAQVGGKA